MFRHKNFLKIMLWILSYIFTVSIHSIQTAVQKMYRKNISIAVNILSFYAVYHKDYKNYRE